MATSQALTDLLSPEEEEQLTHEVKQLLPTLPRSKGWITFHLFQYEGFWYSSDELQGLMSFQQHYEARDTDLLLVTTPKSGTVWLKALAFAIINRTRHSVAEHPLLTTSPHQLVPFLELDVYKTNPNPDLSKIKAPRLFGTHSPYTSMPKSVKESKCRLVYLCRNPKDTLVSFWHFLEKLRPQTLPPVSLAEAFGLFYRGRSEFGPFWEHVLGYWKESRERPQKVLFLKYEEMKDDITSHLKTLAEFMGCPFSLEEEEQGVIQEIARLCSFEKLSNLKVNKITVVKKKRAIKDLCFRKGEVGDWVNYLSPEMEELLDKITTEKFSGSGLTLQTSHTETVPADA